MSPSVVTDILSKDEFTSTISKPTLSVIHFKTPGASIVRSTEEVITDLGSSPEFNGVFFGSVDAERFDGEISLEYNISRIPTVLFFQSGQVIDRVEGVHPSEIVKKVLNLAEQSPAPPIVTIESTSTSSVPQGGVANPLEDKIKRLINSHEIMIFMKGDPATPRCGFSRTLVSIMEEAGVPFGAYDILKDEQVRQGLKTFSNWHTYPQLYVNGELIGGLDIVKELQDNGELMSVLKKPK